MPFGSDPFRDMTTTTTTTEQLTTSPMPFGSDPFRDSRIKATSGRAACGHQCLSAVIPFGTVMTTNQMTPTLVTNAFRQ